MTRLKPQGGPTQHLKTFRDPEYLKSAKGRPCDICGTLETVVFAHMRTGSAGGMGLKPDDRLGAFLCYEHHMEQENSPGAEWWMMALKGFMILRHTEWENDKNGLDPLPYGL